VIRKHATTATHAPGAIRGLMATLVGGAMLAFYSFAAMPAHASPGRAHQPNQQAGTRGKSPSDPDGMSNGGADKPGMTGGTDSYRDGNNGCGNDLDREDDDNGWCGHHPKPSHPEHAVAASAATPPAAEAEAASMSRAASVRVDRLAAASTTSGALAAVGQQGAQVLSLSLVRAAPGATTGAASPPAVLSASTSRVAASPASLARTGVASGTVAAVGFELIALGLLGLTASRRRQAAVAPVRVRSRR
jgi:hypothetical protein